jgi:hypothetical protein
MLESTESSALYLAINQIELAMVLHEQDLQPDRVTTLIRASAAWLADGGAFEQRELDGIKTWVSENRPDLSIDWSRSPADIVPAG